MNPQIALGIFLTLDVRVTIFHAEVIMKKTYIKPEMEVVKTDSFELLSGSDEHGHENACAHGAHAWFCDGE